VSTKITVFFGGVMLCSVVDRYQGFEGNWCLSLHGGLCHEGGGNRLLEDVGAYLTKLHDVTC
jgi:hypothetical protein